MAFADPEIRVFEDSADLALNGQKVFFSPFSHFGIGRCRFLDQVSVVPREPSRTVTECPCGGQFSHGTRAKTSKKRRFRLRVQFLCYQDLQKKLYPRKLRRGLFGKLRSSPRSRNQQCLFDPGRLGIRSQIEHFHSDSKSGPDLLLQGCDG